jgi:hypothetical protein
LVAPFHKENNIIRITVSGLGGGAHENETLELRGTVKVNKTGWGYAYGETRATELPANLTKIFIYVDKYNGYTETQDWP